MANLKCKIRGHELEYKGIYDDRIQCKVCGENWESSDGWSVRLMNGSWQTLPGKAGNLSEKELAKFKEEANFEGLVKSGDIEALKSKVREDGYEGAFQAQGRAIKALGRMRTPQAIDALLELLYEAIKQTTGDKARLVYSLGGCGDSKIIAPLLAILETTTDYDLKEAIAAVLSQFNDPRVIAALVNRLQRYIGGGSDFDKTIEALLRTNGDISAASPILIQFLSNFMYGGVGARGTLVVNTLIQIHDVNSIDSLKELAKNGKNDNICAAATKILKSFAISDASLVFYK